MNPLDSKEALENLIHCKSITKCQECKHKHLCTLERDSNIILQDLERLKKFENLEEELGCSLEVLIKALTEGIIFKIPAMECEVIISGEYISLINKTKEMKWNDLQGRAFLKDYKKTWWLKED